MIEAAGLFYAYPGQSPVLRDVSFTLAPGELAVVAGANGGGKSTLLSLLSGLAEPDRGALRCAGLALPGQDREWRRMARLVVQDADLQILGATVGEDILLGREAGGEGPARALAARFGLADHWDRPVQSLSWGMRRKLCLATALLDAPRLLLLDEPFSGLDYPGILEMRRILADNKRAGLTQVLAAHDLDPVADLAGRLLVLDKGVLAVDGAPADVLDRVAAHGVRPPCSWLAGRRLAAWEEGRD